KVLIKLFQKFAQVEGAKPSSLVATSETLFTAFLWFFLCAYLLKERTETVFSHLTPTVNQHRSSPTKFVSYIEKILSVLF
ncbi:MAG: hypothetical protein IIU63_06145, partial [Clostridia bacterium]|nr:hypothetical protein [Clostridia bacterium]